MPAPGKTVTRSPAFTISALLHCVIAGVLSLQPRLGPKPSDQPEIHRYYTVQMIRLEMPKDLPQARPPERSMVVRTFSRRAAPTRVSAEGSAQSAAAAHSYAVADALPDAPRNFAMPAFAMPEPVHQTLLRPDIPPGITLNQEVPLPNLLPAFDPKVPTYPTKRFVAPAARPAQRAAPTLLATAPDIAGVVAVANEAGIAAPFADAPRLPVPAAAVAQPAPQHPMNRATVQRSAASPSQMAASSAPSLDILSISENPVLPSEVLAIPPANQIAAGGAASLDAKRSGSDGAIGGLGISAGRSAGGGGKAEAGSATGAGAGLLAAARGGTGKVGRPGDTATASGEPGGNLALPGTQELMLPKDGKFAVVVLGSTAAAPYPESTGTLSGKMVYTVYLRVGQRKNWILQYCLPKAAVSTSRVEGTRTPLEAPWPYDIVRPDHGSDSDYVLVHGVVTTAGRFDQLAMVYPPDLDGKDLLLQSLNLWTFRPAKRDGEPTEVEVVLIIPREE